MAAVFNSPQAIKGAFRADKLSVAFGPIMAGMLVQNIQFSFTQAITTLFELAANAAAGANTYLVAGRAQGTASIGRVIGPTDVGVAFITQFGDVCNALQNTISFIGSAGCAGNTSSTYTLSGCVINQIGIGVNSQEVVINEQIGMTYVNLDRS